MSESGCTLGCKVKDIRHGSLDVAWLLSSEKPEIAPNYRAIAKVIGNSDRDFCKREEGREMAEGETGWGAEKGGEKELRCVALMYQLPTRNAIIV